MTDQAQIIEPQQQTDIESIIAQTAPGKGSEQEAAALEQALEGMSEADLLALVEAAYKEDPEANSLVLQRAIKLLDQRGQGEQVKEKLIEIRSESWRDLLGEWIGGELYEVIADQVNEEELLEHGKKALESAMDAIVGLSDDIGLDQEGSDAVKKLAEALAPEAIKQGEAYLESDKGQALLGKISRWVDEHPGYIIAMAVMAAAGAVAADMDIPEIEQKFKLGKGLSGEAGIDLGSLRNIGIEAAKLNLKYVRGQLQINAGAEYDAEKGTEGEASIRYGDKDTFIQTEGTIDPEGNLVVGLEAALKKGLFSGSVKGEKDFGENAQSASLNLRYGGKDSFVSSGFNLDSSGNLKTNVAGQFENGLWSGQAQGTHDQTGMGGSGQLRYGTEDRFGLLQGQYKDQSLTGGLSGEYQLNDQTRLDGQLNYGGSGFSSEMGSTTDFDGGSVRNYFGANDIGGYNGMDLNYSASGLDLSLDARDYGNDGTYDEIAATMGYKPSDIAAITLEYGRNIEGKSTGDIGVNIGDDKLSGELGFNHDGENSRVRVGGQFQQGRWSGSGGATVNLTNSEVEQLSLKLGFRDPKEFEAFSVEFSRSVKDNVAEHELSAMFETELGNYMVRGQGSARFTEQGQSFDASLLAARPLNNDWALIGGAGARYDSMTGSSSIIPQVGVQYKKIPLTVGYDIENKAVTVGISIPFGR